MDKGTMRLHKQENWKDYNGLCMLFYHYNKEYSNDFWSYACQ